MKRALIVVTSCGELNGSGKKTGYYLPEVSHPFAVLTSRGYTVDFASPKGGLAPMDPKSQDLNDPENVALLANADAMRGLRDTIASGAVQAEQYDLVFFAGGLGTMWDFASDDYLGGVAAKIYDKGGVVAAVCHGPAALLNATLKDGQSLVAGRRVAGFSNAEEVAAGNQDVVPFLLETALRERGGIYTNAPLWAKHVVVSDRLVTGQNPASARAVAEAAAALVG